MCFDQILTDSIIFAQFIGDPVQKGYTGDLNSDIVTLIKQFCRVICYGDELYVFHLTHYIQDDESLLRLVQKCYMARGKNYSDTGHKTVINLLKAHSKINSLDVNANEDHIPFKNGYLHVPTLSLLQPNPDIIYTYCIEQNYYPQATCPHWERYLADVLTNDQNTPYRDRLCIMMAICFTSSTNLNKFLIAVGPGGNGKTMFIEWLAYALHNVVSHVQLKNLGDRFNQAMYMHKLLNYYDDIGAEDLESDSAIKTITGSKSLSGEIKHYRKWVEYKNTIHAVYTCNQIPTPKFTPALAFFDRPIVIPFLRRIRGTDMEDPTLFDKLKAETEGIIAYLIPFLRRKDELRRISTEETRSLWYRYGESAYSFYEFCDKDPNCTTITRDLFTHYNLYCRAFHLAIGTFERFGRVLSKLGISKFRHQVNGNYEWFYTGIKLSDLKYQEVIRLCESQSQTQIEGIPINTGQVFNGFTDV